MKDNTYLILAVDAKESHRLQDTLWVPSGNILTVSTLHRTLKGHAGKDVYYTDAALAALVEDGELRDTGKDAVLPGGKLAPLMAQGRNWTRWSAERPAFTTVRPLEAWVHLNEETLEGLEERRAGFAMLASQKTLSAEQLADFRLELVNQARRECAASVRAEASNRLVRIAASRVVVTDVDREDGSVLVTASWTARPAAERVAPRWLVGGFDHTDAAKVG